MNAHIIHDMVSLRAQEPAWQALYERVAQTSLFTSPTWVLNWLQGFATPESLRCIMVYHNQELQAVLPLVRVATRWRRIPVMALCACTNAHSVRSAWLYQPHCKEAIVTAALGVLHQAGPWDVLLLDGCAGADSGAALPPLQNEEPVQHWNHSRLDILGSWVDYLHSRSRDLRRNLRRTTESLHAQGKLEFQVHTGNPDQLMQHWIAIDRASWKAEAGEVVDSNQQTQHYYLGMLRGFAAKQQLLGAVLLLDNNPIATVICAHDKGLCHTLKTAMRQDYAGPRLSTGALVMSFLLEHLWSHPTIRCVDFVSKQTYTDRWTRDNLAFERRLVFAPTLRGRLLRTIERLLRWIAPLRRTAAPTSHE